MENPEKNILKIFDSITDYFSPKVIGEVNDVYVKLAKVKGDKVPWHIHDNEDELFYVIEGSLTMQLKDQEPFVLGVNDLFIVPKGIEHRVYTSEECKLLLIENKGTKHTGDVKSEITKSIEEQL